ncbi:MAG: Hpt domain-containing protein [Acidobacteriia bacterium]|nr:Hpt domain-containing protein [Terriglobia bacterium]
MTSDVPANGLTYSPPAPRRAAWSPPEMLLELTGIQGDLIAELIQAFTADVALRLEQIRGAVTQADIAMLRYEVHAIKGSSKQMAADRVAFVCEQIEAAGEERPISQLVDLVRQLEVRFREVCEAMAWYQRTNCRGTR